MINLEEEPNDPNDDEVGECLRCSAPWPYDLPRCPECDWDGSIETALDSDWFYFKTRQR